MHHEVLRFHLQWQLWTFPHERVEQRLLEVEQEWVAVLVFLELVRRVVAKAAAPQLVLSHARLLELVEDVAQRRLADAPHAPWGELHPPALALYIARLLEHLGQLAQLVDCLPGLVPEQLLRQRSVHVVGPEAAALQLRFEAIHLLEALHETHCLPHRQGIFAEEGVPLRQLGGRHHRLHEAREPGELEAERIVL